MKKFKAIAQTKLGERGASLGSYALIVGLISVISLGAVTQGGESVNNLFTGTGRIMTSAVGVAGGGDFEPWVNGMNFASVSTVLPNNDILSTPARASGFVGSATVSVSGGEFRICSNADCDTVLTDWTANAKIGAGEYLQLRITSGSGAQEMTSLTGTAGITPIDWSVTTGTCNTTPVNYTAGTATDTSITCTGTYRFVLAASRGVAGNKPTSKGRGALLTVDAYLTAGDSVRVVVGNQSGYNGGGTGPESRGGGATDLRLNGTALSNRIAVAGGGGGAHGDNWSCTSGSGHGGGGTCGADYCGGGGGDGFQYCGAAGGLSGGTSFYNTHGGGGGGGGRNSGGIAATSDGGSGVNGSFGAGGGGRACIIGGSGSGGGGGWYGGGGSAGFSCGNGQGGGGSSYWGGTGITLVSHQGGVVNSDGYASMTP